MMFAIGRVFRAAILAAVAILAACAQPVWQEFTARHAAYRFPADQVTAVSQTPHRFIRLSPKGEPFELVFDSRMDTNVDRRGHPQIFSMTATPLSLLTYTPSRSGMVVCRKGLTSLQCGISLSVGGDRWSVLFPARLKAHAEDFASRATAFLTEHMAAPAGG